MKLENNHMMFGFALIALLAIVGFVGMNIAATSNSGGDKGISDAACRAMAENVKQNAQTVIDNPNAVPGGGGGSVFCSSIFDEKFNDKKDMIISKDTEGCVTPGVGSGFKASYLNSESVYNQAQGQEDQSSLVNTFMFEHAKLVEYAGGVSGFYVREMSPGNVFEPSTLVPGLRDMFSCTFDIPAKK